MAIGVHAPVIPHPSSAAREEKPIKKAVQMDQQISDPRLREKTKRSIDLRPTDRHLSQKARLFAGTLEAWAIWRGFAPLRAPLMRLRLWRLHPPRNQGRQYSENIATKERHPQ